MAAHQRENAGQGAGSGAGAPPHGVLAEGAERGIFDLGPGWGGISTVWPQSKQSSMTQFLSGAGNWPPGGIFAARKEMGL